MRKLTEIENALLLEDLEELARMDEEDECEYCGHEDCVCDADVM